VWFERDDIEAVLPHRAPIALLDRAMVGRPKGYGMGQIFLGPDHLVFAGHFPGRPIMPGVLIIEACAQLVALVCRGEVDRSDWAGHPPLEYLAGVEHFKFAHPVKPGAVLTVEAWIGRRLAGLLQARVAASAGGRSIAEGVLIVTAQWLTTQGQPGKK
jgi:3-hydroxyacyl-[acyl-carrier-protein] dehydratase